MTGCPAAGHEEDPARAGHADGAVAANSDARERVTSAAYELHCRAAADSAVYGCPGFVPDRFAADRGAVAAVAELCAAGVWEPVVGGYRILDQRAVQRCLEVACELRREETRTRAWIREREHWQAVRMPDKAEALVVTPACAACGAPAGRVELVAPGQLPAGWQQWSASVQDSMMRDRGPGQWYLIVDGVACGNGYGSPVDAGEAGRIAQAFRLPLRFDQVRTAGFYDDAGFCADCGVPYCARHWHLSPTGYGHCPLGHGKSLDPHWQAAEETASDAIDDNQQLPPAAPAHPEPGQMDLAHYEDLAGRLYGLLIGLGDRIDNEQAQLLHHFIDIGEYDLALEEIAGALAQDKIAITDQERSDMLALNRQMKTGDIVPHALGFCPRAT